MKADKIKIEKIKFKALLDFAANALNQPAYKKVAPISLIRAKSQSKNPYARPDDVVLFLAFSGDQCVGYHGLLPAIFNSGDRLCSVHWATTFFVAPDFRGQGVGKCLLEKIKSAQIDFIVPQMTASAERAYRSAGFKDLGRLNYFQLRVDRLDLLAKFFDAIINFLKKKMPDPKFTHSGFKRLKLPAYRLTQKIFYGLAERSSYRHIKQKFTWKIVDRINESLWRSWDRHPAGPSFIRGTETVNWMLKHPWVVSSGGEKTDVSRYYFSGVREIFRYVAIEIHSTEAQSPKGFLVLSISHKKEKTRVKILDFYFSHRSDCEIAAYLALKFAKVYLADRIEYPCSLAIYLKKRAAFKKLIKKQSRLYMFHPRSSHSPLAVCKGKIAFNYCDGDTAFT